MLLLDWSEHVYGDNLVNCKLFIGAGAAGSLACLLARPIHGATLTNAGICDQVLLRDLCTCAIVVTATLWLPRALP